MTLTLKNFNFSLVFIFPSGIILCCAFFTCLVPVEMAGGFFIVGVGTILITTLIGFLALSLAVAVIY
jgi:hypothetical protein